jgi:hypothetical protein
MQPTQDLTLQPIVFIFHGNGSRTLPTRQLKLVDVRSWHLRFSFSCPSNQVSPSFLVTDAASAARSAVRIEEFGPSGGGVFLLPHRNTPELAVTSTCHWRVRVTGIMPA